MLSSCRRLFRIECYVILCYCFFGTHCPDLIATCSLTCAEIKCAAEVIQKIPISSSGSAAVTERNLLRTVLFFGPHYICFLGLVLGYIRALFCQKLHFVAVFNCSVCALLLVRVSWGVFLAFFSLCFLGVSALLSSFFLVLSSPLCFLVLSIFDTETRLCKARCPHPGKLVYLTYLSYLFVSAFLSYHLCCIGVAASLFSFLLLACRFCSLGFSAFLSCLFCFHFFSSFVSFLCSFI